MSNLSNLYRLVEMGFSFENASMALQNTNHEGLERAVQWLLFHGYGDEDVSVNVNIIQSTCSDIMDVVAGKNLEEPRFIPRSRSLVAEEKSELEKAASGSLPTSSTPNPKSFDATCDLVIHLSNDEMLEHSFQLDEKLSAVRVFIDTYRTDGNEPYILYSASHFFSTDDSSSSLLNLGLKSKDVLFLQLCSK